MKSSLYIGLVHYPMYNKHGDVVATAVTNYDIHDISRSSRTYDVKKYFIIHNVENQIQLVTEIMNHWKAGFGSTYNPDRKEAFSIVEICDDIDKAIVEISKKLYIPE